MRQKKAELKENRLLDLHMDLITRCLTDMRSWRAALPASRFLDARHYGPSDGPGARIAVMIDHLGIRRSGVLIVDAIERKGPSTRVTLKGEFPPIDYDFTFDLTPEAGKTRLEMTISATAQDLFFFRVRTKYRLKHQLESELPLVFEGLLNRLESDWIKRSHASPRHARVTTDGFVEGGSATLLDDGQGVLMHYLERPVAVFKMGETFFAVSGHFPGSEETVSDAPVDGYILTDPSNGWRYDMRTGAQVDNPNHSLPTYACRLEDGRIYVRIQLQ